VSEKGICRCGHAKGIHSQRAHRTDCALCFCMFYRSRVKEPPLDPNLVMT
jgi:hypothetical protein